MAHLVVYMLFLLSGISGLVYQVIWVREFGFIFGNTVYSASTVTAAFMCGLGLGSFSIGRLSDRRHQNDPGPPLRAYGIAEIAIALLGLGVALILPELESISASFSSYRIGEEGWSEVTVVSHVLRFCTALAMLLPITFLMGGTLTLLIRHLLIGDLALAGWKIGALYGLNTAGAAIGAFLTDFSLVPALGIMGTQLVAIAINLMAGLGALALFRHRHGSAGSESASSAAAALPAADRDANPLLYGTALALFASGFVAMGLEIFWFRYFTNILGGFRSVFSLLMTVILAGIFLGSLMGGYLVRRYATPVKIYITTQTLLVICTLAPLAILGPRLFSWESPISMLMAAGSSPSLKRLVDSIISLQGIIVVAGIPSLVMGCTFPLSNAHIQRVGTAIGQRAGALYLANTLGNVSGALFTGFLLLPWLGQQGSVGLLAFLGALGLVPLYLTTTRREIGIEAVPKRWFLGCLFLLAIAIGAWHALPRNHLLRNFAAPGRSAVLAVSEGVNENIVVLKEPNGRTLVTNSHPMSGTKIGSQRYMRLFSHLPLMNSDDPEDVLVICFGVGTTLHAASLHSSVERLEVVDLSRNVLEHAGYFADSNEQILADPRVSVYINDGRQHLRMQKADYYDLITLEPPPISHAGVSALYSREFYELAKSRLRDGGSMTQWLPAYQVRTEITLSIIRSFLDVFPGAVLLAGHTNDLILWGMKGGVPELDIQQSKEALRSNPKLARDLNRISVGSLIELAVVFAGGYDTLDRATRGVPAVTDDRPLMEYSQGTSFYSNVIPVSIFRSDDLASWCPLCFEGSTSIGELAELPDLMVALQRFYESDALLDYSTYMPPSQKRDEVEYRSDPCALESVKDSEYLAWVFACKSLAPGWEGAR